MQSSLLFGVAWLRSSIFTAESLLLPFADLLATGRAPRLPIYDLPLFLRARKSLRKLWRDDARRISQGIYPASVLFENELTKDPLAHLQRLPKIFREAMASSRRRKAKTTKAFSPRAKKAVARLPEYYARNFHFQQDGYLSQDSAELYDHQVDILFAGASDAMRRLVLAPLKHHFSGSDGEGLKFLELGCGAGSATAFLRAAFPKAKITAIDLSEPYLALAKKRVKGVQFQEGRAEKLSFKKGQFDAVVSVFLFHELPFEVRRSVLKESQRLLKKSGIFTFADSLQLGDNPALDGPLKLFPVEFHEPFYTNYIKNPMEQLMEQAGFELLESDQGFFAKAVAARPKQR
jgi:ubiquinone/menaquinone biosynthesis C-methylase UbiE